MLDDTPTWFLPPCAQSYLFVVEAEHNLIFWPIWWQMLWSGVFLFAWLSETKCGYRSRSHNSQGGRRPSCMVKVGFWLPANKITHWLIINNAMPFDFGTYRSWRSEWRSTHAFTHPTDWYNSTRWHACVRAGQFRRRSLKVRTSGNSSSQPDAGRETINWRGRWPKKWKYELHFGSCAHTRAHTRTHAHHTHARTHTFTTPRDMQCMHNVWIAICFRGFYTDDHAGSWPICLHRWPQVKQKWTERAPYKTSCTCPVQDVYRLLHRINFRTRNGRSRKIQHIRSVYRCICFAHSENETTCDPLLEFLYDCEPTART